MFTLVIGGAASGKSEYAEALVMKLDGPRVYLAAMEPFGPEAEARIGIAREKNSRITQKSGRIRRNSPKSITSPGVVAPSISHMRYLRQML